MSITTTRKCDKCGKSWDAAKEPQRQLWNVGVVAESHPFSFPRFQPRQSVDWCRPCLDKNGILAPLKKDLDEAEPVTIESLIEEIVAQRMDNA